jgi:hypothetical protein
VVTDLRGPPYSRVYQQQSWPSIQVDESGSPGPGKQKIEERSLACKFNIYWKNVVSWEYDGNFQKRLTKLEQKILCSSTHPDPISMLGVHPLRYAESGVLESLTMRGEMFWTCRARRLVSYAGWDFNRNKYFVSIPLERCNPYMLIL